MKTPKPWLSFDDQLNKLEQNGLSIGDYTKAKQYLERIGYYRLSGYWYLLRQLSAPFCYVQDKDNAKQNIDGRRKRLNQFEAGSTFQSVVELYVFDKKLRLLAIDALERIEMALRVDVSYLLGCYDPLAHLKPQFLDGRFAKQIKVKGPAKGTTEHALWLARYTQQLKRSRRLPFIQHYLSKYGKPPVWVAAEVWDFGTLSKLFSGLKVPDQNQIAAKYGTSNGRELSAWLRSLNFIRNVSAHHARLWNANVLEISPVPYNWTRKLSNSQPFLYFCIMQKLMKVLCPHSTWGARFQCLLLNEFPVFKPENSLSLKDLGVVEGWENWELWK